MPVYAQFIPRFRWRATHLSDKLPWRAPAAPGVILHKHLGVLQRTYAIRGPDLSHEIQAAQGAAMLEANNVLKRLKGGWSFHAECQRVPVGMYPQTDWPDPMARLIDAERERAMVEEPGSFESRYFLTLSWQPTTGARAGLERLILKAPPDEQGESEEERHAHLLETFTTQADYLLYLLRGILATARALTTDEAATYLKTTVSPRWTPVHCRWPLDLDVRLADTRFVGGWYPYWDDGPDERIHVRVCTVTGYPDSSTAEVMRQMNALGFRYRWVTRGIALDKFLQAGLLRKLQGNWYGQRVGIFGKMAENLRQQESAVVNTDAENKARQADAARQEIGQDVVAYMPHSIIVVVWDRDRREVERQLSEVRQVLEARGYGTTWEKAHATAMWYASHPGNRLDGVRKAPHSTLCIAHWLPGLQATWMGPDRDEHLKEGPWMVFHTEQNTRFNVVNHVQDNGHFKVIGPTRSGKSTLLGLMAAQWRKSPKKQVVLFDLDRSARCLTHCMGGHWYDLGSGTVRLQPYRKIDTVEDRGRRLEWTVARLREHDVPLTANVRLTVANALDLLSRAPMAQRTITEFTYAIASLHNAAEKGARNPNHLHHLKLKALAEEQAEILRVMRQFCRGAVYGLLDGDTDDLQDGPWHCFEQRSLLARPLLVPAVIQHLFSELDDRFATDRPALVLMDDAAVTWALPDYEKKGKEWMVTKAKQNVSLGFFTHSLEQVFNSPLGTLLIESTPQTFAFPNKAAMAPAIRDIYLRLGFNEESDIPAIATGRMQQDCYYACEGWGKRLFHIYLSPVLKAILHRNTVEDHALMDEVMAGVGPQRFGEEWLRRSGFPEEAQRLASWRKEADDVAAD